MSLALTHDQRLALAELMGADTVQRYEVRVADYIEARTDDKGRLHGPPAKWKNLAAVIRSLWRSDQQREIERAGLKQPAWIRREEPTVKREPTARETEAAKIERGKGILMAKFRERNAWIKDAASHFHGEACQNGRVCQYHASKEPVLPTLAQVVAGL